MGYVQRTQMQELTAFPFFITLTYNSQCLPRLTTSTGYDIPYADVHDLQCMFKRLRKSNALGRPFSYFAVSELGSKRGRPHFHILLFLDKKDNEDFNTALNLERTVRSVILSEWRRNVGSTRKPVWVPLCTFHEKMSRGRIVRNFDCHYINPASSEGGIADVGFYACKYLLKPSKRAIDLQRALRLNLPVDEYNDTWSLVRPRCFASKFYGARSKSAIDYVKKCVSRSKSTSSFPVFYNPVSGQSFPLARYYKSRGECFSMNDFLDFYYKSSDNAENIVYDDRSQYKKENSVNRGDKIFDQVQDSDSSDLFSFD